MVQNIGILKLVFLIVDHQTVFLENFTFFPERQVISIGWFGSTDVKIALSVKANMASAPTG